MEIKYRRGGSITVDPKTRKITETETGKVVKPEAGETLFEFPEEEKPKVEGGEKK